MIAIGLLAGCDLGIRTRLEQPPDRLRLLPRVATASALTVTASASYLGPGERIVSAQSPLGSIRRVVDPYGEDRITFLLSLHNFGDAAIGIKARDATLEVASASLRACSLAEFKHAWPAFPIVDADMAKDQAVAFTYVLRSLLLDRELLEQDTVEGRLAFRPRVVNSGGVTLHVPLSGLGGQAPLTFAFHPEERAR